MVGGGRKTAFILAGGGSRGAYQAGCLRRLEEEGIEPDLIIGSSIGVCNSLVYATSGAEVLWEFWSRTVALPRILKPSLRRNALFGNSLFSMSGLTDLVESEVDFDRCFDSETELTYV
ncbi:MAG: patatin-like phospholipase family protein, partial [Geodermatophilaceae bacterium]